MGPIIFGDVTITSQEVEDRMLRAAGGLAAAGLRRGEGLALVLRNDPTFLEASLAAGVLGLYPVPINWHCVPDELRFILDDSGARAIVIHADLWERLKNGVPDGVHPIVVDTPDAVIEAYGLDPLTAKIPGVSQEWASWRDRFSPHIAEPRLPPQTIFYTSGTTGRPKGVKRAEMTPAEMEVFLLSMKRSYGFMGDHGAPEEIVTVASGPLYHGLPNGHALYSVRSGARLIIMPRFDAEELLAIIEREKVTHLNLVPIMFNRLLRLPEGVRSRYNLSSLRFVAHAAAPVSPAIKREMIAWWGPVINEYYGSTETANVVFCNSEEWLTHPGTVGRAPAGTQVRIVDDEGTELPPGEIGNIVCCITGAGSMTYLNNEAARKSIELAPGLVTAGDMGYLDEDGFLYICDRSKDMIISGGVNIYPAEIEGVLQKMPGVADCAVFGIPDDEFGEAVHAVIQPLLGAKVVDTAVKVFLRERVASYKIPRSVDIVHELPREDSGKIFKQSLRAPFCAEAGRKI